MPKNMLYNASKVSFAPWLSGTEVQDSRKALLKWSQTLSRTLTSLLINKIIEFEDMEINIFIA